jgi:hypothetical protein
MDRLFCFFAADWVDGLALHFPHITNEPFEIYIRGDCCGLYIILVFGVFVTFAILYNLYIQQFTLSNW